MAQESIYFDKHGKPRLFPSYCIFVGILGFKDEITNAYEKQQEVKLFETFINDVGPIFDRIIP